MYSSFLQNRIKIQKEVLRLFMITACTLALCAALLLRLHFGLQLALYLLLLAACIRRLQDGLLALSSFAPSVDTLLLLCALAALLEGVAAVTDTPYFAYAALSLAARELGGTIGKRLFGSTVYRLSATDRICRAAVSAALFLFALTMTVRLALGAGFARAAESAAAVLIVSCPAGIGGILPLVNLFAAKCAERYGVLLQNPAALLKLGRVRTLIIGQPAVVYTAEPSLYDVYAVDADKPALLATAAAIEQCASHPFADAIVLAAAKLDLPLPRVTDFAEFRGKGVRATVASDAYFLGNKKLFREQGIPLPDAVRRADLGGRLPLYAAKNGCFCGMLLLENAKKPDVSFAAEALRAIGVRTYLRAKGGAILLDGDTEKVLQEPKNNATIKTMIYCGEAEKSTGACCTAACAGKCDVLLPRRDLYSAYVALLLGKKAGGVLFCNLLLTLLGSTVSLLLASGVLSLPFDTSRIPDTALWIAAWTLAANVLNSMRLRSFAPPPYTPSEEDVMFGKVHYTMHIEGMSCTHCSARVKTALESLRGTSAEISLEEKVARVKCPASLRAEALTKAVTDAGYTVLSCERV